MFDETNVTTVSNNARILDDLSRKITQILLVDLVHTCKYIYICLYNIYIYVYTYIRLHTGGYTLHLCKDYIDQTNSAAEARRCFSDLIIHHPPQKTNMVPPVDGRHPAPVDMVNLP